MAVLKAQTVVYSLMHFTLQGGAVDDWKMCLIADCFRIWYICARTEANRSTIRMS